jgi:phosphatidylserine synthase
VLLYLFALGLSPIASLAVVCGFVLLTFMPLLAVHPFRVAQLRPLTCVMTALWTGAAVAAVVNPFPSPFWVQALLLATAAYLSCVGFYRVFRRDPG